MINLLDIEMRGRMRRMTLGSRLVYIGLAWGRLRADTNSVKRKSFKQSVWRLVGSRARRCANVQLLGRRQRPEDP